MSLAHRSTRRRMLLASDRADRSRELAAILQNAGDVEHTSTLNMPENPEGRFSGVVVDIDLTSIASMQVIRRKLIGKAYQALPRLFVLADALQATVERYMAAWSKKGRVRFYEEALTMVFDVLINQVRGSAGSRRHAPPVACSARRRSLRIQSSTSIQIALTLRSLGAGPMPPTLRATPAGHAAELERR